ncbi:MAG: phenylacetate--CoA ligase, partial [Lentisphaerae bacterium]|nr:phenylacetate--CoA ligase [Lentisphaerota bacterium]
MNQKCQSLTAVNSKSAIDYLPVEKLSQLQSDRFRAIVKRAYTNTDLFRKRMDDIQLNPEDIGGIEDITKLPFSVKTDLRETYPFGMFACPMKDVVRLHASSGTTGKPIVVAYTGNDLNIWSSVILRTLAACGVQKNDIIQNAYGYGLFTGGLGLHYGGES